MAKKAVRFTNSVKKFILDKMAEGHDIAEISRKWPDQVPARHTIYRKAVSDKDFAEDINQAYTVLLMHRMDELHRISGQTATEAYPEVEDWRQAEAALKRRIDEAKFVLGKMAPILSRRFDKADKVEVSGIDTGPKIAIINYHTPSLAHSSPAAEAALDKESPKELNTVRSDSSACQDTSKLPPE